MVVNSHGLKEDQPSILMSTFFEPSEQCTATVTSLEKSERLKPVLINDEYFCIGNPASEKDEYGFFTLSVTVSFAENLLHLFPSISLWPPENTSFEFRFSLFGNSIHLQPFGDLRNPVSIGEKATVKIQTSVHNLLDFFNCWMTDLSIYLCCEEITIAEMTLPIRNIIKDRKLENHILKKLDLEPLNISGIYPLRPLLEGAEEYNNLNSVSSAKSQIGVVFLLAPVSSTISALKSPECWKPAKTPSMEPDGKNHPNPNKKERELYETVLAHEIWKEQQKMIEQQKLQRSSQSHLELLNSEYRRQVSINEAAFQVRLKRVEELEEQLENAILMMRRSEQESSKDAIREKKQNERIRAQILKEKSQLATEVDRITRSLKAEHQSKIDAERRRHTVVVSELRQKYKTALNDIAENRKRILELEQELEQAKNPQLVQ